MLRPTLLERGGPATRGWSARRAHRVLGEPEVAVRRGTAERPRTPTSTGRAARQHARRHAPRHSGAHPAPGTHLRVAPAGAAGRAGARGRPRPCSCVNHGETPSVQGLAGHVILRTLLARYHAFRICRTRRVLEALAPAIIEQKVTGDEAARRGWRSSVGMGSLRTVRERAVGPPPGDAAGAAGARDARGLPGYAYRPPDVD
jgi:hypothetical protein